MDYTHLAYGKPKNLSFTSPRKEHNHRHRVISRSRLREACNLTDQAHETLADGSTRCGRKTQERLSPTELTQARRRLCGFVAEILTDEI
jgi:hypothetical protein